MKNGNDVVLINLDKPRELRFGHKALKTLVSMTGKSLEDLESSEGFDMETLEQIIYCGLLSDARKNGEKLELADMEDLLDQAPSYGHILEKVQEAFSSAFGVDFDKSATPGNQGKK